MALRKGFTLIELMVTIVILAIMFIGLLQMVILGMEADTAVKLRIYAQQVLSQQVENLRLLSPDEPAWQDPDNGDDRTDIVSPDFGPDTLIYRNIAFEVIRNVVDSLPEPGMKTSRIIVLWNNRNQRIWEDVAIWTGGE